MEFATGSSKKSLKIQGDIENYVEGTNLQYYKTAPQNSISLAEFEELALERLKGER